MSDTGPKPEDAIQTRVGKYVLAASYVVIVIGCIRIISMLSVTSIHNDFSHYYLGGKLFAAGQSPYVEPLEPLCQQFGWQYDPLIPHAAHPPLLLTLFAKLSAFSPITAYCIWLFFQFAFLVGCLEITRKIIGVTWRTPVWCAFVAIFLNSSSLLALFYYSQVQLLIGLFIYAALAAHLGGKHVIACGCITFIAAFKIYPAVLLPWILLKGLKGRSDLARRTAVIVAVGLACLLVPGPGTWIEFITMGIPTLSGNALKWTNYSVQNFVFVLAHTPLGGTVFNPNGFALKIVAQVASIMMLAVAYVVAFSKCRDDRNSFCLIVIAAVMSGFIAWAHYLTILMLPIALLVCDQRLYRDFKRLAMISCVGMMVLMPQADLLILETSGGIPRVLIHFYPLIGAALTALLLVVNSGDKAVDSKQSERLVAGVDPKKLMPA